MSKESLKDELRRVRLEAELLESDARKKNLWTVALISILLFGASFGLEDVSPIGATLFGLAYAVTLHYLVAKLTYVWWMADLSFAVVPAMTLVVVWRDFSLYSATLAGAVLAGLFIGTDEWFEWLGRRELRRRDDEEANDAFDNRNCPKY